MINEFLRKHRENDWIVIGVVCKDGFEISIQASEYHYCEPRITDTCDYMTVECGYPKCRNNFDEMSVDLTIGGIAKREYIDYEDVYPYVPVETVNALLSMHGGIANM